MSLISEAIQQRSEREQADAAQRRKGLMELVAAIAIRDLSGGLTEEDKINITELIDDLGWSQQDYESLLESIREVRKKTAIRTRNLDIFADQFRRRAVQRLAEHKARAVVTAAKKRMAESETARQIAANLTMELAELRDRYACLFDDTGEPITEIAEVPYAAPKPSLPLKTCCVCTAEFQHSDYPHLCSRACWSYIRDYADELTLLGVEYEPAQPEATQQEAAQQEVEQPEQKLKRKRPSKDAE